MSDDELKARIERFCLAAWLAGMTVEETIGNIAHDLQIVVPLNLVEGLFLALDSEAAEVWVIPY